VWPTKLVTETSHRETVCMACSMAPPSRREAASAFTADQLGWGRGEPGPGHSIDPAAEKHQEGLRWARSSTWDSKGSAGGWCRRLLLHNSDKQQQQGDLRDVGAQPAHTCKALRQPTWSVPVGGGGGKDGEAFCDGGDQGVLARRLLAG
jgi:hypothetical protein